MQVNNNDAALGSCDPITKQIFNQTIQRKIISNAILFTKNSQHSPMSQRPSSILSAFIR